MEKILVFIITAGAALFIVWKVASTIRGRDDGCAMCSNRECSLADPCGKECGPGGSPQVNGKQAGVKDAEGT